MTLPDWMKPRNSVASTRELAGRLLLVLAVAAVLLLCLFPELPGLFHATNQEGRQTGEFLVPYTASLRDQPLPPVTQLAVAWGAKPLLRLAVLAILLSALVPCHAAPSLRRHPWLAAAVDFAVAALALFLTVAALWAMMLGHVRCIIG